ncbi:SDR family oxidoreductase [Streptomyces sp. NPDC005181]|uniref:SDR family oxidoreductase n=1 Tax=Streptomyces sp. NPDC005181 TaxID=3156869 RepID=UPI0033A5C541
MRVLAGARCGACPDVVGASLSGRATPVQRRCDGGGFLPCKSWDHLRRRDPEAYEAYAERNPSGHLLNAEEVARVITYLLSPASGAVNGAHIPVDGGQPQAGLGTDPGRRGEAAT